MVTLFILMKHGIQRTVPADQRRSMDNWLEGGKMSEVEAYKIL